MEKAIKRIVLIKGLPEGGVSNFNSNFDATLHRYKEEQLISLDTQNGNFEIYNYVRPPQTEKDIRKDYVFIFNPIGDITVNYFRDPA